MNRALRLCVLGMALLLHGCLQPPKPVVSANLPPTPPAQATFMTETLAEAEDLRTAMAAERIKAAKQTAKLQTARNQVSVLRNREIEHVATIATLEKELSTVKTERDELQKEVTEFRAQTANVPQLLQMVTHVRILETSLKGMVSSIDRLSNEMAQLKEQTNEQRAMAMRPQKRAPAGLAQYGPDDNETVSIVVKRGDSLWSLAHRYHTTVAKLKTWNNLDRDLILVGQVLKLLPPAPLHDDPDLDESLKAANQPTP